MPAGFQYLVGPFCSALSFDRPLELQVSQLGIGRMRGLQFEQLEFKLEKNYWDLETCRKS